MANFYLKLFEQSFSLYKNMKLISYPSILVLCLHFLTKLPYNETMNLTLNVVDQDSILLPSRC